MLNVYIFNKNGQFLPLKYSYLNYGILKTTKYVFSRLKTRNFDIKIEHF